MERCMVSTVYRGEAGVSVRRNLGRDELLDALDRAGGERKRAAEILGVGRATLYRLMHRHGISSETGRLVSGRYEIVRDLGRGAQGRTFEVVDHVEQRAVRALKRLESGTGTEEAARLREEFRILSRLRHPGLVSVHDFGDDESAGAVYLVMELVEGRRFDEAASGCTLGTVLGRFSEVLRAVGYLHRHGLVHRDLKPENVLVGEAGVVKVADLGLTEPLSGPELPAGGTLLYCAPELLDGERASFRSDLYALGVMLYVTLAGKPPFAGADPAQLVEAHRSGRFLPLSEARGSLPTGLNGFIERLLAVSPRDRFADCGEAAEALAGWIGEGGAGRDVRSGPADRAELELVGRDDLLAETLQALDESRQRGYAGVLLEGEAGMGKSRVLDSLARELRARGRRVARAQCVATPGEEFLPLAQLAGQAVAMLKGDGIGPADGALLEECRDVLAFLDLRGAGGGEHGDLHASGMDRAALFDGLNALIEAAAKTSPLVLMVDDLHVADSLVIDALRLVSDGDSGRRIGLIAAARPEAPEERLGGGRSPQDTAGWLTRLSVGPLDRDAVALLTRDVLGSARSSLLGTRLHDLTGGHPLYLQTVLQELLEAPREDGAVQVPETLPESLRGALERRIVRVPRDARTVLEWLAVRGGPSTAGDLGRLSGVSVDELAQSLEGARLVERDGVGRLDFAHALLRDAVLGTLDSGRRREMHLAWAAHLEGRGDAVLDRAAQWLAAGERGPETRGVFLEAAAEYERTCRATRAIPFLQAVIGELDEDDETGLELLQRLEAAHRARRDGESAIEVCRMWARRARRAGRPESEARALAVQASWHRERGEVDRALEIASAAVEGAERTGDLTALNAALKARGTTAWVAWRREDALRDLERALEAARRTGDSLRISRALADVVVPRACTGDLSGAFEAMDLALEGISGATDLWWELALRTMKGFALSYAGDLEGAVEESVPLIENVRRRTTAMALTDPLENLGLLAIRAGRYELALASARDLIEEGLRYGKPRYRISGLLIRGEASAQLDDFEAARLHDRLALDTALALGEEAQERYARLAVARDLRRQRDFDGAVSMARQAYEAARSRGNPKVWGRAALEIARCAREVGDLVQARRWRLEALEAPTVYWEESHALRAECVAESARVHVLDRRWELAAGELSEAAGLARRAGPRHLEIELLVELADAEQKRGEAAAAREALHRARRLMLKAAEAISDSTLRSRYVNKPEHEALRRPDPVDPAEVDGDVLEGARADLQALYEVSRSVAAGSDPQVLLECIVRVGLERVGAERAAVVLRDARSGELAIAASNGLEDETAREVSRLSRSVLDRADRGQSVLVADTRVSPELSESVSVAMYGIRSVMCVPLRAGDEILGTLYVDSRKPRLHFHEGSLRFLQAVADLSGTALAYTRLVEDLTRERKAWRDSLGETDSFEGLVGRSKGMRRVYELIDRVAPTTLPVIVCGASGTGKELVARAIHQCSPRAAGPFLTENCAAIPEGLLESTLFGHERGAFTGADTLRRGLFERADGGTLLLDEIGDMSPALQARLLRVLQDGRFRRVGGAEPVPVDVRVIGATHHDLPRLIAAGRFRQDLYFRLNGLTISLPALRDREDDLPLLVAHFLERECAAAGRAVPRLEPSVWRALLAHPWPGNVRELHAAVRRLLLMSDGPVVRAGDLGFLEGGEGTETGPPLGVRLRGASAVSRDDVDRALRETGGNRAQAAARLGISRATLYRKLRDTQPS